MKSGAEEDKRIVSAASWGAEQIHEGLTFDAGSAAEETPMARVKAVVAKTKKCILKVVLVVVPGSDGGIIDLETK